LIRGRFFLNFVIKIPHAVIEVFKTNVETEAEASDLLEKLALRYPSYKITIDWQDCDHVLRVQSFNGKFDIRRIKRFLHSFEYYCETLSD
jgi:hypothetical protein